MLPRQFADPQGWQLQNMLQVARLMIAAAIEREETRGVHHRADHPGVSPAWMTHVTWQRGGPGPVLQSLTGL